MADINRIKRLHGFVKELEATDSKSELKNIVMTKHLAQGPWYKCSKGILYHETSKQKITI